MLDCGAKGLYECVCSLCVSCAIVQERAFAGGAPEGEGGRGAPGPVPAAAAAPQKPQPHPHPPRGAQTQTQAQTPPRGLRWDAMAGARAVAHAAAAAIGAAAPSLLGVPQAQLPTRVEAAAGRSAGGGSRLSSDCRRQLATAMAAWRGSLSGCPPASGQTGESGTTALEGGKGAAERGRGSVKGVGGRGKQHRVERELSPYFEWVDPQPLASASIAQVPGFPVLGASLVNASHYSALVCACQRPLWRRS
jgi:hypothetical protein